MQRYLRILLWSTTMVVVSTLALVGTLPRSVAATRVVSPAAARYHATLMSCWTNPPASCAYGGADVSTPYVTLVATISPALQTPLRMRIVGQKVYPSTGPVTLIRDCGQLTPCRRRVRQTSQGLTTWHFWLQIVGSGNRVLQRTAGIRVAWHVEKFSHLELLLNGKYYTEDQLTIQNGHHALYQMLGTPLKLTVRWNGPALDGRYTVRVNDGYLPACTELKVCAHWVQPYCTTGKVCNRTVVEREGDGLVHYGNLYYAELWYDHGPTKLLDTQGYGQKHAQGTLFVTWCNTTTEPCHP